MPRLVLTLTIAALFSLAFAPAPTPRDTKVQPKKKGLESILKDFPRDEDAIEQLFLLFLERKPTARETKHLTGVIRQRAGKDRREMFKDLEWALTNSLEYLKRQKAMRHPERAK